MKTNHCKLLQGSNAHKALTVEAFQLGTVSAEMARSNAEFLNSLCVLISFSLVFRFLDLNYNFCFFCTVNTHIISQECVDFFVSRGLLKKHGFGGFVLLTLGEGSLFC